MEPQEMKTTDKRSPTAYSYCIEGQQATETFSMGEERAWMFSLKECMPESISNDMKKLTTNWSTSTSDRGNRGVSEQVTSEELQGCRSTGMSCYGAVGTGSTGKRRLLNSRCPWECHYRVHRDCTERPTGVVLTPTGGYYKSTRTGKQSTGEQREHTK
jgi:hypothetical protein